MKFSFKLDEIKYVKISYKDSEGYVENIKAAIKEINDREILACAKFEDSWDIALPQEVDFSVICIDGLYKTKTILKAVELDEPYVFFVLETPSGIEYQQNREYFRVLSSFNCIYKINFEGKMHEFSAVTADISANGVSILLPNHVISDKLAELIININGVQIVTNVKYVRSEKLDDKYRISFSFAKLSDLDRDFISQVCIQKQLEQKRNRVI